MNFLHNINLNGNQLQNFLLHPSGTAPAGPGIGMTYFDTNASVLRPKIYSGSAWKGLAYEADLESYAKLVDFNALQQKVNAFLDGGVDADGVLENLKEIQAFLDTYDGATALSDALNAINTDITTLRAAQADVKILTDALGTRIAKFEDMFEWDGDTIRAKASFYSVGQIAAGGAGEEGDGSGGGVILDFDSIVDALGYTPADEKGLSSAVTRIAALESKTTAMAKKFSAAITAGSATEYTITHSLGTRDVVVQVYDPGTYEQVMVDVVMATTAAVKIVFASAPSKNYKVVVVG